MRGTSIIIPCFNLGQYLLEAVESVMRQTVAPAELIIVDDGSTDEQTLDVLEQCRREATAILRTTNQGAPAARNHGISRARCDYVLCLDADDVLLPTYLENTVPVLDRRPEVGVVTPHVEFFGEKTGIWQTMDYNPAALLRENCISSASLFRRVCWEQVGGYCDLPAFQDWDFWISVMEAHWKWTVVPKPLYRYRVRAKSISEYGRANRGQLLRTIVQRHLQSYEKYVGEIVVAADHDLRHARQTNSRYARDNAAQTETIKSLNASLRRLHGVAEEPTQDGHASADVPVNALQMLDVVRERLEKLDLEREFVQADLSRWESIIRLRTCMEQHVPSDADVLVVSRGDGELLNVLGESARHFPQNADGAYLGYHPASSADAIEHLESLRKSGAAFILFPGTSAWWLDYYTDFALHLDLQYREVARLEDGAVLYSLAAVPDRQLNRFSVVICTYRRAEFVTKAIESLFQQRYPKDKYEIIVVNNDSPDDTERRVKECAERSPVPFQYLVEKRNGLSHARNLGVAHANFEYVAHLDDDATACPDWLASFNKVLNEHHALVVGGRVEKVFEPGFVPPQWFHYQYIQGFFGLNYREWGKKEKVFRIRFPRYIGGGNSVYAKWLYQHFGGYDPRLGRDGKTLMAAEETYLNWVLDRHDVPIYYSDDAVIYHFIESSRLTKKHVYQKARWGGVSNAIMCMLMQDARLARERVRSAVTELKRLTWERLRSPGDPKNFSRRCRMANLRSFLSKYHRLRLRRWFGGSFYCPASVSWRPELRAAEIEHVPEGADKYRELYHFYAGFGLEEDAERAYAKLIEHVRAESPQGVVALPRIKSESSSRREYEHLIKHIREVVGCNLPPESHIIVISKGDDALLALEGRTCSHFPQLNNGEYAGHYPADCQDAVAGLQRIRKRGEAFLLIPQPSFWWLEHYPGFKQHLEADAALVFEDPRTCLIYRLREAHDPYAVTGRQKEIASSSAC